jgi:hypothetical protein
MTPVSAIKGPNQSNRNFSLVATGVATGEFSPNVRNSQ